MKIAVPTAAGKLCMHFGHCEKFVVVDVDDETKKIVGKEELVPPPHEPGLLPKWLHEKGATVIIAGGMGMRAQQIFLECGIKVVVGAPAEHPQEVILSWLKGDLVTGGNTCDH
jgi:predicted Fe-Mo cluster-binding NifX family protein